MNETDRFLDNFKRLERKLIEISTLNDKYVSFSRALNKVYYSHLCPAISNKETHDFLKSASDLRNIISHQVDICLPTKEFNDKFEELVTEIINPLECIDIATKGKDIFYVKRGYRVVPVVRKMVEKHLSHVPVIEGERVIGVFSKSTFFDYLYSNGKLTIDDSYIIGDFLRENDVMSHFGETYIFVSKDVKAYSLLNHFVKKKAGEKRTSVIFITEDGKKDSRLLGVLTETDLLKLPLYERKIKSNEQYD